jgi:SAM-dependent methyltransferase
MERSRRKGILQHYGRLWFFLRRRYEDDNYRLMREYFAGILIDEIEEFLSLRGAAVLDVGGGRGEFCGVISRLRGARAVNLDPNYADPGVWPDCLIASAERIPFADGAFDLVICRGVLEHIPPEIRPEAVREMRRVTRPGGFCYISIPPWLNPHAGHGLRPFHLLPFPAAKFLKERLCGYRTESKSYADEDLYPMTSRGTAGLIRDADLEVVATRDTHLRLHFLTKVPLLREVLVPVVSFVARRGG